MALVFGYGSDVVGSHHAGVVWAVRECQSRPCDRGDLGSVDEESAKSALQSETARGYRLAEPRIAWL